MTLGQMKCIYDFPHSTARTEVPTNPYDFTRPVKDRRFFAGREKELKEVRYYFEQASGEAPKFFSLALVGKRASGKTSLLNMIGLMAKEMGFLPVKVSLNNDLVASDVAFFKEVFDGIMTQGSETGMYGGLGQITYKRFRKLIDTLDLKVELPFLFGTAYVGSKSSAEGGLSQQVVIHDLKEMYDEAKKKGIPGIVLLLDECDLLSTNETLLQKIRNVFQDVDGYILVLAGTEVMFPQLSKVFSPIPRFFKRIDVKNFQSIEETEQCILSPLSKKEVAAVGLEAVPDIHRFTRGSPYEINLVAHHMYKRYGEGKSSRIDLNVDVLDDVMSEIERLRTEGHHEVASRVKMISTEELGILRYLSSLEPMQESAFVALTLLLNIDDVNSSTKASYVNTNSLLIRRLIERGIVQQSEEGELRLGGDDFDQLYVKYLATSKDEDRVRILDHLGLIEEYMRKNIMPDRNIWGPSICMTWSGEESDVIGLGFSNLLKIADTSSLCVPFGEIMKNTVGRVIGASVRSSIPEACGEILFMLGGTPEEANLQAFMADLSTKLKLADLEMIWPNSIEIVISACHAYEQGDYDGACALLKQVKQTGSAFLLAYYNLTIMQRKRGDVIEAADSCTKMLGSLPSIENELPEMASRFWILASLCHRDAEDPEGALSMIDRAISLSPDSVLAWNEKARTLELMGRDAEAEECRQKTSRLKDSEKDLHKGKPGKAGRRKTRAAPRKAR